MISIIIKKCTFSLLLSSFDSIRMLFVFCFLLVVVAVSSMQSALANSPSLVKDIQSDGGGIRIQHPTIQADDGTVYFFIEGNNGGGNDGLYKTDGTDAGTVRVKQLAGDSVKNIAVLGNKLLFSYDSSSTGVELWVSDGTSDGTHIIEDLNPGNGSGLTIVSSDNSHSSLMVFNGYIYFGGGSGTANGGSNPSNLYRTDGNTIEFIKETSSLGGGYSYAPDHFVIFNNRLFFTAKSSHNDRYIWSTDGTEAGTEITIAIWKSNYSGGSNQPYFKVFKNKLCFVATSLADGNGLWCAVYDADLDQYTATHHDIDPSNNYSGHFMKLALATDSLLYLSTSDYYSGNPDAHGHELWAFSGEDDDNDGKIDPPYMLKDINIAINAGSLLASEPENQIAEVNGLVVFAAYDGVTTNLWKTDGTPAGTILLKDFSPQSISVGGSNGETVLNTLTVFNNAVYFKAGSGFWRTDGTSTRIVTDTLIDPKQFSVHGDSLYMIANAHNTGGFVNPHGHVGEELFKLDKVPTKTLPHNQWEQIALPCDAVNKRKVSDIFGDDLDITDYKNSWTIYAYNTESTPPNYVIPELGDDLSQNKAYWIIQLTGADVTIDMPSMCDDTPTVKSLACNANDPKGCYEFPLATKAAGVRWQMLGNVFEKSTALNTSTVKTASGNCDGGCSLSFADSNNIFHQNVFAYNGSAYDTLDVQTPLTVWQGAWAATLESSDGLSPKLLMNNNLLLLE